jgi:sulfide:quinone oxidoreductase
MSAADDVTKPRVLVAGGGIAGMEALLALADLLGEGANLTMAAPEPDFRYRPMAVDEPFSSTPYERRELAPAVAELGATFVRAGLRAVHAGEHAAELDDGSRVEYAATIVCVGARPEPAFANAVTFTVPGPQLDLGELLGRVGSTPPHRLAFVVPTGVAWSLPLYELALLTARRVAEGAEPIEIVIVTPEEGPLAIFGPAASEAVATMLDLRGISVRSGSHAREAGGAVLELLPGGERLEVSAIVALPVLRGPSIPGLPSDEQGFIPIDDHGGVKGLEGVYAAGDGANFPIKQGGIGTQQADAAAEAIAAGLGADIEPRPFHPVLRGKLLIGEETMSMRAEVTGGGGEGIVSSDHLWWPPFKVSGRYLTPWLAGGEGHPDPEPPTRSLEVEVALPHEWHKDPMALDPYRAIDG